MSEGGKGTVTHPSSSIMEPTLLILRWCPGLVPQWHHYTNDVGRWFCGKAQNCKLEDLDSVLGSVID